MPPSSYISEDAGVDPIAVTVVAQNVLDAHRVPHHRAIPDVRDQGQIPERLAPNVVGEDVGVPVLLVLLRGPSKLRIGDIFHDLAGPLLYRRGGLSNHSSQNVSL